MRSLRSTLCISFTFVALFAAPPNAGAQSSRSSSRFGGHERRPSVRPRLGASLALGGNASPRGGWPAGSVGIEVGVQVNDLDGFVLRSRIVCCSASAPDGSEDGSFLFLNSLLYSRMLDRQLSIGGGVGVDGASRMSTWGRENSMAWGPGVHLELMTHYPFTAPGGTQSALTVGLELHSSLLFGSRPHQHGPGSFPGFPIGSTTTNVHASLLLSVGILLY